MQENSEPKICSTFHTSTPVQARRVQGHLWLQTPYAEAGRVDVGAVGSLLLRPCHWLWVLTLQNVGVGSDRCLQYEVRGRAQIGARFPRFAVTWAIMLQTIF